MKYAIETLNKVLNELKNHVTENSEYEEEDLIGAVLHNVW